MAEAEVRNARVILCGMHRIEGDGDVGVLLEFLEESTGPKAPQVVAVPKDEMQAMTQSVIQGTMTALQQAGMPGMPTKQRRPKMILYLTMQEYGDLDSPQINDVMEISFLGKGKLDFVAPEFGSIICLKKVDGVEEKP